MNLTQDASGSLEAGVESTLILLNPGESAQKERVLQSLLLFPGLLSAMLLLSIGLTQATSGYNTGGAGTGVAPATRALRM